MKTHKDLGSHPVFRKYVEELPKVDDLTLVVLKGHFSIESALNRILETFVFHKEYLNKLNLKFEQKIKLIRSISWEGQDSRTWDLLTSINTLRNDLAHSFNSETRRKKINSVKILYFSFLKDAEVKRERNLKDTTLITFATSFCLGFLFKCEEESISFRTIMQKTINRLENQARKV